MNRSRVVGTLVSIVSGAGLILVACSDQTQDDTGSTTSNDVTARSSEARTFCGNNHCDHHETCSSCPQDCGTCGGTAGTTGSAGTTGGGGSTGRGGTTGGGGTTGTGGTGGSAGICGSTAAPPAHYQHVVIFSFENRTWSNVGLGFSATTMPYLHSLASQCSYLQRLDRDQHRAEQPHAVHRRDERREQHEHGERLQPVDVLPIDRQQHLPAGARGRRDRAELRRGRDHRLLGQRQRRQAHPGPLLLRDVHGRHRQPQRSRLLQHRGQALQRVRRQQPADLRVHHADPVQRRPRLQRRDRRRVGEHQHPAGPRQRRVPGGYGRGLRLVRRRSSGAEPPHRADLAQGQHHADRRRERTRRCSRRSKTCSACRS